MLAAKAFEVRDSATFIPCVAVLCDPLQTSVERPGYSNLPEASHHVNFGGDCLNCGWKP